MLKSIVYKSAYYTPLKARDSFVGYGTESFTFIEQNKMKINALVRLKFDRSIPTLTQTAPTPLVIN